MKSKLLGLTMAIALLAPIGVLTAGPASAAGGTTCKPPSGTVKLTPGLVATPKVQTITINLPISGCKGGGVTGGTFKGSLKTTAISIGTFAKSTAPLKLNSTTTWNTKKTSTLVASSTTKVAKIITSTVKGKISKGVFAGLTFTSVQTVTLGKAGAGGAITTLNIKGSAAVTIK
jgi:hypothetical protein